MSEVETKRIIKQVPDLPNPPDVWEARLNQTKKNRQRVVDAYRQQGMPLPPSLEAGWGLGDDGDGGTGGAAGPRRLRWNRETKQMEPQE
jgi:hypothetical protein